MMDNISIILEWDRSPVHKAAGKPETRSVSTAKPDINAAIAARIHAIRDARGLSIESVADKSGVSRSMISLIERGETSPTAALLEKLAAALGTTLARLFEPEGEPSGPVTRKADQPLWRDPASGYVRRNVSPAGTPIQIVEISFPPGAEVAYDTTRLKRVHHQVWVLSGTIEVTVGSDAHALAAGDCLAFVLDRPTRYRNRTRQSARYAVIIVEE